MYWLAQLLENLFLVLAIVVCVAVGMYAATKLITHAVLKTRSQFQNNGGDEK